MFTGLVREFGRVESLRGSRLRILARHKPSIGDSIAVNGVCLTAIAVFQGGFVLELSEETQKHIALENYQGFVHLEPAMRLSDRLDGHIVQGHVDGIGVITKIIPNVIGTDFLIQVDSAVLALCVPKGSIAIDGISLTINALLDSTLRLTIIPHTLQMTLFRDYKEGMRVNIETDCLARMVRHFLSKKNTHSLSWAEVDRILGSY